MPSLDKPSRATWLVVCFAAVASLVCFIATRHDPLGIAEIAGGSPWWSAATGILAIAAIVMFLFLETLPSGTSRPRAVLPVAAVLGVSSLAMAALSVGAQVDTGWSAGPFWLMIGALVVIAGAAALASPARVKERKVPPALSEDQKRALDIQEQRIRHADTQAAGIMVLAATVVGLLASGEAAGLGGRRDNIGYALAATFGLAIVARLIDIAAPAFGDMQNTDHRATVAFVKGLFIAGALIALGYGVYEATRAL